MSRSLYRVLLGLIVTAALAVGLSPNARADERLPIGVLPKAVSCTWLTFPGRAGAWPVPLHAPNPGIGLLTMPRADARVQRALPPRIHLRTDKAGFNSIWQYALYGGNLYAKSAKTQGDWRIAPVPQCLQGQMTALSVDESRLVVLVYGGRAATLESADETPELWWWTTRFGSPIWLNPGGTRVRPDQRAWSFSWLDPIYTSVIPFRQEATWTDTAGHKQPVGGAGVTTVYTLSKGGNRIFILDPWLPGADPLKPSDKRFSDDYSYEMLGPLDGRFVSRNLSSSGSTTFVINDYGDMYTRLWDFDISGADTLFFSYTPENQGNLQGAPNNFEGFFAQYPFLRSIFPQAYAKFQLPPPAWVRQPKVPGEITSAITIRQTGFSSDKRELRVEGRRDGRNGYWFKPIDPNTSWSFAPVTDYTLSRGLLDNRSGDTSSLTLVPGADVNYRHVDKAGWTLTTRNFDYATDTADYDLCVGGTCARIVGYLAPTPRPGWTPEGLTSYQRLYQGMLVLDANDRSRVDANPRLRAALRSLIPNGRMENIIATANTSRMTLFTLDRTLTEMPRFR